MDPSPLQSLAAQIKSLVESINSNNLQVQTRIVSMERWQEAHEQLDGERWDRLDERLADLKATVEAIPKEVGKDLGRLEKADEMMMKHVQELEQKHDQQMKEHIGSSAARHDARDMEIARLTTLYDQVVGGLTTLKWIGGSLAFVLTALEVLHFFVHK